MQKRHKTFLQKTYSPIPLFPYSLPSVFHHRAVFNR